MYRSSSRFWKIAATIPLAAAALSASGQPAGYGVHSEEQVGTWTFHHENVLGTSLAITVRATNLADAERAEAEALRVFDHDDAILSTWRSDSEVSRWAKTRFEPVAVSPELFEVLAQFDAWRERTNGALDPSVEAATRLWNSATAEGRVPSEQEIAMVREAMQQPHWELDAEHRTATKLSDVPLALASFTKSYVSSRAADAALKAGATGVVLNVGGDVIVRGNVTQMVAIADPLKPAENDIALDTVVVHDRAVATSGSYRRGFDLASAVRVEAPQFSHLIDPHTARPVGHVLSSTVIAKDATTAGALATAFSILPVEESRRIAETNTDIQYLLVLDNGDQVMSAAWPRPVGFRPVALSRAAAVTASAGMWNPAYELSVGINLPRVNDARYKRLYVAVWIEDSDHYPVRTLALWFDKTRWLNELKQWYRDDQVRNLAEGTDVSRTVSSATRSPGSYTVKWDGKDNAGKPVKAGKYTICIEAAREHGGYDLQRKEVDFDGKSAQANLPAGKEIGASTIDYHKR